MPQVMVKPESLRVLGSQLQLVAGDVQAIEARLSSVMAGLDWEVRSRAGVENQWYNARSLARSTAQRAEAMARFLIRKAQAFEDADRQGEGMVGQTGMVFVAAIREWVQSPFGKTNSFSWQKIDDIIKLGFLGAAGLTFPAIGMFALPFVGAGILNAVVPGLMQPGPTAPGPTPPPSPSGPAGGSTASGATPPGTGTTPPVGGCAQKPGNTSTGASVPILLRNPNGNVTNTKAWEPVIPFVTNRPGQRSKEAYNAVINQFDVENNPRYQKRKGKTYCNIFAWDVSVAMGVELPRFVKVNKIGDHEDATGEPLGRSPGKHKVYSKDATATELDANRLATWLGSEQGKKFGWREVSAEEAQRRANQGYMTVSVINKYPKPGHVQVIRPTPDGSDYNPKKGVYLAQAGSTNTNGVYFLDKYTKDYYKRYKFYTHD